MSRVLTNENNYYDIADTIRQMKNVNTTYKPREMASALKDIYSNEVEGTLPLSFEANGNNLLDYRIDGASGGVGERTSNLFDEILDFNKTLNPQGNSEGFDGRYCCHNSIDVSNISSCTISWKSKKNSALIYALFDNNNQLLSRNFGNVNPFNLNTNNAMFLKIGFLSKNESTQKLELYDIYDVMVNEGLTAMNYEPYGYKVPVVMNGRNLLPTPEVKSQTVNGVTISRFVNGIITIKGTPTAQMDVKFNFEESTFSAGSYIHLRNNFSTYNFAVSFRKDGVNKIAPGLGTLNSIKQITEDITVNQMVVLCNNNAVGTNYDITIQPSIELTNEETSYEPYHEPTTTNIYLDEPIEENESISLSDTEVDIPTIEGTNTLTIDTTVQPSNVYVQAPKDSEEIVYLTTILEEEI